MSMCVAMQSMKDKEWMCYVTTQPSHSTVFTDFLLSSIRIQLLVRISAVRVIIKEREGCCRRR